MNCKSICILLALCFSNTMAQTDGFNVTSELTFSNGVTSSNFDSLKYELALTLTDVLGVPLEWVSSLTLKSDVVVVAFLVPTRYKACCLDYMQDDLRSNYFVPAVNRAVNFSQPLTAAGVVLDFTDKTTCWNCETCDDGILNQDEEKVDCGGVCPACPETCDDGILNQDEEKVDCGGVCPACPGPTGPTVCKNVLPKRRCRAILMNGKCGTSWSKVKCCATCRAGCANIWKTRKCMKLIPHCRRSSLVRRKCQKACRKCK